MTRNPSADPPYDPWADLATNWPEVAVHVMPLPGDLLGLVRYPLIVLRADCTAAQHRSTLAHEIVHLERGVLHGHDPTCPVADLTEAREENRVERIAAARLISVAGLAAAIRHLGPSCSVDELAVALDVDRGLLRTRVDTMTTADQASLRRLLFDDDAAA